MYILFSFGKRLWVLLNNFSFYRFCFKEKKCTQRKKRREGTRKRK